MLNRVWLGLDLAIKTERQSKPSANPDYPVGFNTQAVGLRLGLSRNEVTYRNQPKGVSKPTQPKGFSNLDKKRKFVYF